MRGDSVPLSPSFPFHLVLVLVHISRAIADLSLDLWRGEPVAKLVFCMDLSLTCSRINNKFVHSFIYGRK